MNVIVGENLILTRLAELRVLEDTLQLPHEVIIPDVMLADELVDLHGYDLSASVEMGARFGRLDGEGVELAMSYHASYPGLSTTETFALVLVETADEDSVLLTGQPLLCRAAEAHGHEVRGLPWILDEIYQHNTAGGGQPQAALWRGG